MNLTALQATLRQFAAERDWQAFHTPKNLAMALLVEAAELAEIFQWLTPEQSQAAHTDQVLQAQIADEVADVFLYLMQLADHTAVDLPRAVGRKLVKNAKKHPPLRPGLPAGTAAVAAVETHVLVDWENVQPKDTDLRALVPDVTDVWLFHGPRQQGVGAHHGSFGERATLVKIARAGPNALDFHLSFYMGYIASRHPDARFVVVSNDKGYGPMLEHAAELGFSARQVGFDNAKVSAAKAAAKRSRAKLAAPAPQGFAMPPLAKQPLAKPAAAKLPIARQPIARQPIAKQPIARQPIAKPVTAKPPAAQQPAAKQPAAKNQPAAKKVAPAKPATAGAAAAAAGPLPGSGKALAPPSPSAKAAPVAPASPAGKSVAAKAVAAAKPVPAASAATPTQRLNPAPAQAAARLDLAKAAIHVLASLKKTQSRPARQRSLMASIKSLVGPAADAQAASAVLARLLALGSVVIDGQGAVEYRF